MHRHHRLTILLRKILADGYDVGAGLAKFRRGITEKTYLPDTVQALIADVSNQNDGTTLQEGVDGYDAAIGRGDVHCLHLVHDLCMDTSMHA